MGNRKRCSRGETGSGVAEGKRSGVNRVRCGRRRNKRGRNISKRQRTNRQKAREKIRESKMQLVREAVVE